MKLLFLINHGYFYESFFRPLIRHLSKKNQVSVWFDSRPGFFCQDSFQIACQDRRDGLIVEVESVRLVSKKPPLSEPKDDYVIDYQKLDIGAKDFGHVFALNSSLPANLPLLQRIVSHGSKLTVVRPMTIEHNFRLLYGCSRNLRQTRLGDSWGLRLFLVMGSLPSIKNQISSILCRLSNKGHNSSSTKDTTAQKPSLEINFLGYLDFISNSLVHGPKDWLDSTHLFANTRITDMVLLPNPTLAHVMSQIAPGPIYSSFGPRMGDIHDRPRTLNLGICAPPGRLRKSELSAFIEESLELVSHHNWERVSFRHHPTGPIPDNLLSRLTGQSSAGEILISESAFDVFASEHSHFIIPNSNSSLPVILNMQNPNSTLVMTKTEVSSVFFERSQIEDLSEWALTFEEAQQLEIPRWADKAAGKLPSNMDIFQMIDSILGEDQ